MSVIQVYNFHDRPGLVHVDGMCLHELFDKGLFTCDVCKDVSNFVGLDSCHAIVVHVFRHVVNYCSSGSSITRDFGIIIAHDLIVDGVLDFLLGGESGESFWLCDWQFWW